MTDRRDSSGALDAELAHRVEAEGRMAAALVELENHPGHRLTPTGRTAERWTAARDILAGLWQDFGTYQAVVAAARTVRFRRARPGDRERAELRHLLVESSIEVARTAVALPERRLTGAAEHVETITLEQLSVRMDTSFAQVNEVVVTCEEVRQAVLPRLTPLSERVLVARELARDLVPDGEDAAVVTTLTELATVSTRLAGLAAIRDGWDDQLAQLAATLDEIDLLRNQEEQARQRAQELIAGTGLTAPPERLPLLRHRLAALSAPAGWSARAAALAGLWTAVQDAAQEMRAAHERAQGLQDRRAELCGRFEAYRAKATRLGHAEHPDVLALDDSIRQLLWARPGDLAAATRALAAYQRLVQAAERSGTGRPA